jgi:tRNA pseudouridine13 synthase
MQPFNLDWAYLFEPPTQTALFKAEPEDFRVQEDLGFPLCGEGEHVYVHLRKRNENTAWVAKLLAEFCQCPNASVSWAGLKDRHAVTEQWFSIHLPGKPTPDFAMFASASLTVLDVTRHDKKLRPGMLAGNAFTIRLRDISDPRALDLRLQAISERGVPNYFGAQRFGHEGNNLQEAAQLLSGQPVKERHKRAIYLSAARSYLFNQLISARIENQCFFKPFRGDYVLSMTSDQAAIASSLTQWKQISQQVMELEYCVTGPLWGSGPTACTGEAADWEANILQDVHPWLKALEHVGMQMDRRRGLLKPQRLCWRWVKNTLELQFTLGAGSYATSVLRELINLREPINNEDSGQ